MTIIDPDTRLMEQNENNQERGLKDIIQVVKNYSIKLNIEDL